MDGIAVRFHTKADGSAADRLAELFDVCVALGEVPEGYQNACVVPLYKGKTDKNE